MTSQAVPQKTESNTTNSKDAACYFESTIHEAYNCYKALEFIASLSNKLVPLSFSCSGIVSNNQISKPADKTKKINGYVLKMYLEYKSKNLPDFGFFIDGKESSVRCSDPKKVLSVGINLETLTDAFSKTLKPTSELYLFSKSGQSNLFYGNSKDSPKFTLKAAVGHIDQQLPPPKIPVTLYKQGNNNSNLSVAEISLDNESASQPNFSNTVQQFMELCNAIKQRPNADVNITVYTTGAQFRAVEYGTSGKEVFHVAGICSKKVGNVTLDAAFFSKLCGSLDKFADSKSIVHFYFSAGIETVRSGTEKTQGLDQTGGRSLREIQQTGPVVTLVMKIGNSGTFVLQKEVIPV